MTFHDLRATDVKWCAVRGDDPLKITQRAGHASFSTTEGYIREAENLRDGFGEVFGSQPRASRTSPQPLPRARAESCRKTVLGTVPAGWRLLREITKTRDFL